MAIGPAALYVPALQTPKGSTMFEYAKLLKYYGEATNCWVGSIILELVGL